jgi:hypothetical protein
METYYLILSVYIMKRSLKLNSINTFWLALGGSSKPTFRIPTRTPPSNFSNPGEGDGVGLRNGGVIETHEAATILRRFY